MDGVGGKAGWRWILIMDGIITIALGFFAYMFIVDFPEQATKSWRFLNQAEVDLVMARIEHDRRDVEVTPFSWKEYLGYAGDWRLWFHSANFGLTSVVNYSVAYFLPIVLRDELGFSLPAAQCLNAPVRLTSYFFDISTNNLVLLLRYDTRCL
jgi:hypothetical protein